MMSDSWTGSLYAVILAGGAGTRLWPLSRRSQPKQLLRLFSERTLLQTTWDRLRPLILPERILTVAPQEYLPHIAEQLPELDSSNNLIAEPEGKGSAAAIGLAALHLRRRAPAAIMACLPADHFIADAEAFRQVLGVAAHVAEGGHLVTLGIVPDRPETGYGYIQRGAGMDGPKGWEAFQVKRFVEKPPLATARRWVRSGRYFWNSGMFVWKAERILEEIMRWMPTLGDQLMRVAHALGTPIEGEALRSAWAALSSQTIDYGVMEKAQRVAVIPARMGWSDVGHWQSVLELGPADASGSVVMGQHVGLDTRGSLIYSPHRLVATIGIEDMVIVDSGDAILVCPRQRAQEVRALVEKLSKMKRDDVL